MSLFCLSHSGKGGRGVNENGPTSPSQQFFLTASLIVKFLMIQKNKWPPSLQKYLSLRKKFASEQAEKLKSRKMKEGWMKNDEGWMKNDERWKMMISSCWGVLVYDRRMDGWTNERTDICECIVAFATGKVSSVN